jgi:predicted dehydrogenase
MLKGAIVGFGEVARHGHWPAFAESRDAAIVAVVDRTAERRALAASLGGSVSTHETIEDLARAEEIDFIDICTPPALHPQPMLEAINRRWHVLCEKPFLLDPVVVEVVRANAAAAGVAVVPVDNWKYAPIVRRATDALRSGAIGELRQVEIETSRLRNAPSADPARPNWRRDAAIAGGGILMDHGWHAVYLTLHWFGAPASAVGALLHHPPGGGVEDEATLTLTFPTGEATIALTWNGNDRWNSMRLIGDRGEIVIADDVLHVRGATMSTDKFDEALSAGSHHAEWFSAMLPAVLTAFHEPARARASFDEAAQCLSIIQRAYRVDMSLAGKSS